MDQLSDLNNKLTNIVYFATLVFCLVLFSSITDLSTSKKANFQIPTHVYEKEYSEVTFFEHNGDMVGGQSIAQSIILAKSATVAGVQDEQPSATTLGGAVKIAMQQPQNPDVLGISSEDGDKVDATSIMGSIEQAKKESKRSFSIESGEATAEVKGESVGVYYEKPNLSSLKGSIDYAMMLD